MVPQNPNIIWEPLDCRKVVMSPVHIKLGFIRQFVTALDKKLTAFKYVPDFFPKLNEAKVKASDFIGSQIKSILECMEFPGEEKAAWNSFAAVV